MPAPPSSGTKPFSEIEIPRDGSLPLVMSEANQKIFESMPKRKIAKAEPDKGVLIGDTVTVCRDGSGNFTTINEAIASAPNNTNIQHEYVSVPKQKMNLTMMGDGINQTALRDQDSFVAIDLTIRNTAGPAKQQAVALKQATSLFQASCKGVIGFLGSGSHVKAAYSN
ncbi:hypothetical protein ACLOJK_026269 [Asimina triloba]